MTALALDSAFAVIVTEVALQHAKWIKPDPLTAEGVRSSLVTTLLLLFGEQSYQGMDCPVFFSGEGVGIPSLPLP